ncbi:MAG: MMPL family transporter [Nocardioidaceae bacterium]
MSVSTPVRPDPRPPSHTRGLRALLTAPAGRRSKVVVLLGLIGVLLLAGPLGGKVGEVEDNGPTSALPRGAESTFVEEQLPEFARDGVVPMVAVYARDGGLTGEDRDAVADDREILREYAHDGAVAPVEYSQDGGAAVLALGLDLQDESAFDSVPGIRSAVAADVPDGLDTAVSGPGATFYDEVSVFAGLDGRILAASAAVVTLLLLLTYRSPVLWMVPLASVAVAMVLSQALIYLLAEHAGLPVDGQSGGILPILVFGVGTDYALLLIARYREELRRYDDRHVAMAAAVRRAGPAILASAATVVLGLSCLLLADLNSTRSLGAVSAIGVACAAASMLVVLPMLLVLTGRWVLWPFAPRPDAGTGVDAVDGSRHDRAGRQWHRVAGLVARAPRRIWIGTSVALAVVALGGFATTVGTTDEQQFRDVPDSVRGQSLLEESFPAGRSAPVDVVADAAAVDEVRVIAAEVGGVSSVAEPVTSVDGSRVLVPVTLDAAPDSDRAEDTVSALRQQLEPVGASVGGATAEAMDVADSSARDAAVVIPAALVVVLLVLVLLLRAVVGPLVLLATVLLSYAAAFGAGALAMRAMGFKAVDVSLPLLAFVFLVALGVDYTIFLMSRVREEVLLHGPQEGVLRGLVATGGAITSAGLVLAATFAVLTVMPITFMVGLGVVVALGVLIDTFVVRTLVVPTLALDLSRGFWAPSRLGNPDGDRR